MGFTCGRRGGGAKVALCFASVFGTLVEEIKRGEKSGNVSSGDAGDMASEERGEGNVALVCSGDG
jgi:hypothetical protein